MKAQLQFTLILAALGCLLAGAARSDTAVAQLPLKASVLAKPNIIFGLDDSGSMDWEILLDTTQGMVWWSGTSAWDAGSQRPFRTSGDFPMGYLFPLGTATGTALYDMDSYWGQAIAPINQLAWTRSNRFNPIYYDSLATYRRGRRPMWRRPEGLTPTRRSTAARRTRPLPARTDAEPQRRLERQQPQFHDLTATASTCRPA
jgi:type IV pilus assembly protein PilY1